METNTSNSFHSCNQGRSILTRYCGEREAGIVIFGDYSSTLELLQGWYQFISLLKINLAPPNIHSEECKKCLCSCVHHVCFSCVWGIVWYWQNQPLFSYPIKYLCLNVSLYFPSLYGQRYNHVNCVIIQVRLSHYIHEYITSDTYDEWLL